ncbi:MAG: ATP-binding protein [Sphingobacteriia bacterium]|nr:ATP-binding protein [Sphingobacteriia bacterium]
MMDFVNRHITEKLKRTLKANPVTFLNGARQTGKSSLVQQLAPELGDAKHPAEYQTFDRPTVMAAASAAPEAFLKAYQLPLILDEVQLVPGLFRALKVVVDEMRLSDKSTANGKFILTGSANIMALPQLADPLVGRMSMLTLYPFTASEATYNISGGIDRLLTMNFRGMQDRGLTLQNAIRWATYPEISKAEDEERKTWFDGYITSILQRDVKQIADLEKSALLPHMLQVLASRIGGIINESDIGREVGMNSVTGKSYRNILKMMFLTFDIKPWSRNIAKRLVKSPKGYFIDTSLACHILDYKLEDIAKTKPELYGHMVENFVATELLKQLANGDIKAALYYYGTSDGKEIDFILEKPDGTVLAIEVKKNEKVTSEDFKIIRQFETIAGPDFIGGIVLYAGKDVVPFGTNLWAVPFHVLW